MFILIISYNGNISLQISILIEILNIKKQKQRTLHLVKNYGLLVFIIPKNSQNRFVNWEVVSTFFEN